MFRFTLSSAGALLIGASAAAQTTVTPTPITAPVKDAGTYHVATGTWTRPGAATANFGPLTVYNNDAPTMAFFQQTTDQIFVDEGNVPSAANSNVAVPAANNGYTINGFQIGYCTYNTAGPMMSWQFYGNYVPCTDPATNSSTGPSSNLFDISNLGFPATATQGMQACWIVTIDTEGTPDEFCLEGDGADGFHDNDDPTLDSFGFTIEQLQPAGGLDMMGNPTIFDGPIVAGDPAAFPEGDGTNFSLVPPPAMGTGRLTQDGFRITDTVAPANSGCFWFGGYAMGSAFASFHMQLLAATPNCGTVNQGPIGTNVCFSFPNSTGNVASISAFGTTTAADQAVTLTTTNVNPNSFGLHYFGANQIALPFGDGIRCVGGQIFRMNPVIQASGSTAVQDALTQNVNSGMFFTPNTWIIQYWFRDPSGPLGTGFNFSDALLLTLN